jgi:hypothetical protein
MAERGRIRTSDTIFTVCRISKRRFKPLSHLSIFHLAALRLPMCCGGPLPTDLFFGTTRDQQSREGACFAHLNMLFITIGKGRSGAVRHEHPDAKAAVLTAARLLADALTDVCVIAPDGRIYQPAEFYQLLNGGKFEG